MQIFIFQKVEKLTENYHTDGALVIVAEDLNAALTMAKEQKSPYTWKDESYPIKLTEEEIANVIFYDLALPNVQPALFIFPDAGCC